MDKNPYAQLPPNLPVPEDDGACAHLRGKKLPDIALVSTSGEKTNLLRLPGLVVLYAYPMTGRPGVPLPAGWDEIPGARGCTPQACTFRDHHVEIRRLGATVLGLSTQSSDYQKEVRARLHLPFDLLSDEGFQFSSALSLPAFEVDGMRLLKRFTLVIRDGVIGHVFYPVFPPDKHAQEVVAWLGVSDKH